MITVKKNSLYSVKIVGSGEQLEDTLEIVHYILSRQGVNEDTADGVSLAVGEACHNAVHHSYDSPREARFDLELKIGDDVVRAVIMNRGDQIDYQEVAEFHPDQDFSKFEKGGLGISVMKKLMAEVESTRTEDNRNCVTLIKYFSSNNNQGDTNEN